MRGRWDSPTENRKLKVDILNLLCYNIGTVKERGCEYEYQVM